MWIKRSNYEIQGAREENARKLAIFWSIFVPAFMAVSNKIGYSKHSTSLNPITWSELADKIHIYFIVGIVLYTFIYFSKKNKREHLMKLCTKCDSIYTEDEKMNECKCGNQLDFLEDYKFVEDQNDSGQSSDSSYFG